MPTTGARCSPSSSPSPTTTAATSRSAPTGCSTSAWATAAAPATRWTARPGHLDAARLAAAHRPAGRRAVRDPRRQPLRRRPGRRRRDLRLRAAQPLAVLLRPRHRPAVDRRRRPGRARGGQRPATTGRWPAPTTAGTSWRARGSSPAPSPTTTCPRSTSTRRGGPIGCAITGGYVYRGGRSPSWWGRTCSPTTAAAGCTRWSSTRTASSSRTGDLGVSGEQVVSFARDADGELYLLDFGGAVHRIDPA
jgi:hypothetical protein